jgi:hypothetical protein
MKAADHFDGFDKEDIVAFTAGFMTEGLSDVGFPHACRSVDKDRLFFLDEDTGCQVFKKGTFDLGIKGKIKAFEGLLFLEGGTTEPLSELFSLPSLDLILDHDLKEGEVVKIFLTGLLEPQIQGFQESSQPEGL